MSYVTAVRAGKIGQAYEIRGGDGRPYTWQWYALVMSDGTERHTSVPAGARAAAAARHNVSETRREPTGAGHWHQPDLPRVFDALPCPDGRCS
jgi:hypothetical protein